MALTCIHWLVIYIERDVRQLKNIANLRSSSLSFAQDCGISHTTMQQWLNILEASYLIFFLQPFHQSFNKSLIKMPKLYFYDTGLACTLLGLEKESQLETHYLKGALFENLIVLEIFKKRLNQGLPANIYFWRDRTGHEVDLLAEWGGCY
ncbi:MAG: DUF4143 domain-containing protein [Wolbachia endosymbiont of Polyergus mexicanus]|uniref:DUF4143 domain-containing protein n=1 Tax=Wolbachia endosymbiont of Polyergus mexicanus TaxID=3171167 RepID=A0AAU7YJ59_9RICK